MKTLFTMIKREVAEKDFAKGAVAGSSVCAGLYVAGALISNLGLIGVACAGMGGYYVYKKIKG